MGFIEANQITDTTSASPEFELPTSNSVVSPKTEVHEARSRLVHQNSDYAAIELAVFNYISAVRALGRTQINTAEIADALRLDRAAVEATIESLRSKNVRVIGF